MQPLLYIIYKHTSRDIRQYRHNIGLHTLYLTCQLARPGAPKRTPTGKAATYGVTQTPLLHDQQRQVYLLRLSKAEVIPISQWIKSACIHSLTEVQPTPRGRLNSLLRIQQSLAYFLPQVKYVSQIHLYYRRALTIS